MRINSDLQFCAYSPPHKARDERAFIPEFVLSIERELYPKLTLPLPESSSPPLRLIKPPLAAAIVPWQSTKSLIVPQPPMVGSGTV